MGTAAIIVAAGRGERMGHSLPKQFLACAGRPLVAHSLQRFCLYRDIETVVVALPEVADLARQLGGASAWPAPVLVVRGGKDRQASVAAGLEAVSGAELVLVHDGVRPLVPVDLISRVCRAAAAVGAAVPVLPCSDTIKSVQEDRVQETLDRRYLVAAQTPQGFRTEILREAHRRALADGVRGTDDAALVERLGLPVGIVEGAVENIKVTRLADLVWVEYFLAQTGTPETGPATS